jgi:hypothetical protein
MRKVKFYSKYPTDIDIDTDKDVEVYIDEFNTTTVPEGSIRIVILEESLQGALFSLAANYKESYTHLLTYQQRLLNDNFKATLFHSTINSWIRNYILPQKKFCVSTLVGGKDDPMQSGYVLRHNLWRNQWKIIIPRDFYLSSHFRWDEIDYTGQKVLGDNKNPLFNSMFHIAIENTAIDHYFSEKLLDCFQTKTIPIYYGCTNIHEYFNINGILTVNDLRGIIETCNNLTPETYEKLLPFAEENLIYSNKWRSCEGRVKNVVMKILKMNKNEIIDLLEKDNACQTNYINNIVSILDQNISGYSIVITSDYLSLPATKYKKIVILAGEDAEMAGIQPYSSYTDVVAVFRFYGFESGYDNRYSFPIPSGYNCRSNGKMMVKMYPEKKISERKYDLFFSGQKLDCRKELESRLSGLSKSFNVNRIITSFFRQGLDIDDYYNTMGDSKICVVPDGTSVDTFRFSEACGSGCIIITTPKTDLWYYHNAPVFYVKEWSELTEEFIRDILSKDLDAMQNDVLRYYNECLSEEAVANYILKCLKS